MYIRSFVVALALIAAQAHEPPPVLAQAPITPPPPPPTPDPPPGQPTRPPPPAPAPTPTPAPAPEPPPTQTQTQAPTPAPAADLPPPPPADAVLPPSPAPSSSSPPPPAADVTTASPYAPILDPDARDPGSEAMPSLLGPAGLLRLSGAEVGAAGQVRFGIAGEFFSASDFLVSGDRNMRLQGGLVLSGTPLRFLEVFGAISGSANRNRRICTETPTGTVCNSERDRKDPEVIKSYGDLTVGTKFAYPLGAGVSAGGELGLRFLSSVSGISFDPSATSVWLGALTSWDMRGAGAPLRAHLNVGLYFDNSGEVQDYAGVITTSKAVSQFAYGIARDRVRTGLGLEAMLLGGPGQVSVRPFVEYHLELVTVAPDPTFDAFRPPMCGAGRTMCRDNRDQQWVTLGVRTQGVGGFGFVAGLDVAMHSVGFPYGPPLPPWNLIAGISHNLDFGRPKVVTVAVPVARPAAVAERRAPQDGFVVGKVISASGGAPVEGAIVAVAGKTKSRVATDPDGGFKTAAIPPGAAQLEVGANGFESTTVPVAVVAGEEAPLTVTLTPRVVKAKVSGKITDDAGKGVAAAVLRFNGPQNAEVKTDESGAYSIALPNGPYTVRVEAEKYQPRDLRLTVTEGQDKELSTSVSNRAGGAAAAGATSGAAAKATGKVTLRDRRLVVKQPVSFKMVAGLPAELTPTATSVLDDMVAALAAHPEVKKVRIEAHWDGGLAGDKAKELTEQQARTVAAYLTKQGVPEDRLEVVGMGAERPIVPNIGTARFRNRRVEFHVVN